MSILRARLRRIVKGKLQRLLGQLNTPPESGAAFDAGAFDALDETPATDPEAEELQRCLAILELSPSASAGEIKSAYRRMCRRYHPDRFASDEQKAARANELLAEVNRAYEILSKRV